MTGVGVTQEEFKVEAYGMVTPPPSATEVLDRIYAAADSKQPLTLSASELRVLVGLL